MPECYSHYSLGRCLESLARVMTSFLIFKVTFDCKATFDSFPGCSSLWSVSQLRPLWVHYTVSRVGRPVVCYYDYVLISEDLRESCTECANQLIMRFEKLLQSKH